MRMFLLIYQICCGNYLGLFLIALAGRFNKNSVNLENIFYSNISF